MRPAPSRTEEAGTAIHLRNEFAAVELRRDDAANGPRVRITDLGTGRQIFLDLLEVESLTRFDPAVFGEFIKPP